MCRLLGFVAASPASVRGLVGDAQIARFSALAALHGDGWGSGWVPAAGDPPTVLRSAESAVQDPGYGPMVDDATATARIVHLRWATEGFTVDPANTHPFFADGLAFAHNGSISPGDRLDGLLGPGARAGVVGDTDSERYFALIRQELAAAPGELGEAAVRAASALRRHYPDASLNALILSADELVVVHANSPRTAPIDELLALPGGAPLDHVSAYFLMRWQRTSDGSLIFASSGMHAKGWEPLPEESVTIVDLRTRELRHLPLADELESGSGLVA